MEPAASGNALVAAVKSNRVDESRTASNHRAAISQTSCVSGQKSEPAFDRMIRKPLLRDGRNSPRFQHTTSDVQSSMKRTSHQWQESCIYFLQLQGVRGLGQASN